MNSRELLDLDRKLVWHPFTTQQGGADPLLITSGKGSLLYDAEGRSYIDAISSWWVNLHGHAHPFIAERVYRQALTLEQVIFAGFTHEPAVRLASELLPLLPGDFEKVFYSDNGSTSVEVALKMAIQYWWNKDRPGRKKLVAFRDSYHGDTFGAMSVSDRGVFTLAFHDLLLDVVFIDTPTAENILALKALVQRDCADAAAFIYEPLVQGAGGMKMYEASLLNELLAVFKRNDVICIADEVMTGFGRTGKLFAGEYLQEKPDIICLSKGLTGGTMALGATACTARVFEAYNTSDKLRTFFHGHSFTANPLACAAALASLELLQQPSCFESIERISRFTSEQAGRFAGIEGLREVRSLGTILAFELSSAEKDGWLNAGGAGLARACMEAGVYVRPLGNTVYVMPPYCVTEQELRTVYEVLIEAVCKR